MAFAEHVKHLGATGTAVSSLGYGCMGLSIPGPDGEVKSSEERLRLLDHIYDSGARFWDTSDVYGDNENLIGAWLKSRPGARQNLFIATKVGNVKGAQPGQYTVSNDSDYIRQQCQNSLKRLGVDWIDLYYIHRAQKSQPIEITVRTMKELKDEGKVKHIGLSEISVDTLRRACSIVHIDAIQMEFSPFSMDIVDRGILDTCRELGIAVVAYAPLGKGFLTGRWQTVADLPATDLRRKLPRFSEENFPQNIVLVEKLKQLAAQKHCTVGQLVLAWEMRYDHLVIPIPGTTRLQAFDENIGALKVVLSAEEMQIINDMVASADIKGGRYPAVYEVSTFVDTISMDDWKQKQAM